MPVTFCFINQQNMNVCTTGFPMGCYVTKDGKPKDACVLDVIRKFLKDNFNYKFRDIIGNQIVIICSITLTSKLNTGFWIYNLIGHPVDLRDLAHDSNFLDEKIGGRIIRIKIQPRRYLI